MINLIFFLFSFDYYHWCWYITLFSQFSLFLLFLCSLSFVRHVFFLNFSFEHDPVVICKHMHSHSQLEHFICCIINETHWGRRAQTWHISGRYSLYISFCTHRLFTHLTMSFVTQLLNLNIIRLYLCISPFTLLNE